MEEVHNRMALQVMRIVLLLKVMLLHQKGARALRPMGAPPDAM